MRASFIQPIYVRLKLVVLSNRPWMTIKVRQNDPYTCWNALVEPVVEEGVWCAVTGHSIFDVPQGMAGVCAYCQFKHRMFNDARIRLCVYTMSYITSMLPITSIDNEDCGFVE